MAHLIDTMAYAGETPWHGLGANLPADASIDQWIAAAGLTWEADLRPIMLADGTVIDGRKAVVRNDTGKVFDVVSNRYKPVQPREVLEFFRDMADSHGMQIETAGALKEGAVVWGLATNGRKIALKGTSDIVKPYLLLSTSFDGSQASRGAFTSIRVVCNNTLRLSYATDKEGVVSVRHTTQFDAGDVKARLGLFDEQTASFTDTINYLAESRVTGAQVESLLTELFGSTDDKGELTTYSKNVMSDVFTAITTSPGAALDTARGTAWGVLNGITNYVDFSARARNQDNRLDSAWFGRGDALKGKALAILARPIPQLQALAA